MILLLFSLLQSGYITLIAGKKSGFLAPFVLKFIGAPNQKENTSQYQGQDVVLLNIWKTRCDAPRVDILLWLPFRQDANSIVQLKGPNVNKFLRFRYCDPQQEFDVRLALR